MHIKISGKQIDVGEALQTHVEDRLSQAVYKYFERPVGASVVLSRDAKNFFKCDASVNLATGLQAQAHGNDPEIYAAFEQAAERIEKQIRRYKRRLKNHHQRHQDPIDLIAAQSYVLASAEDDPGDEAEDGTDPQPVIIAETQMEIRALSVGDAVMQMELAHAPFLIFKNRANGRLNLVYQREDGNVGWVDPDLAQERPDV
ncbi:MAG: ribosome-associated translation inhibitor RaiA [Pseudomonadota bacterium]